MLDEHIKQMTVSTHSRLKAAGIRTIAKDIGEKVSTHSRLKAAGIAAVVIAVEVSGFNTQPPEGGWYIACRSTRKAESFNTQPPEGGWRGRLRACS